MNSVLKQVIGIDVAQNELVTSVGRFTSDLSIEIYGYKVFKNTQAGFSTFLIWLKKNTLSEIPLQIVMEATGVYHQKIAYFLVDRGYNISVVLPNKVSNFQRTLDIKTINDKTMSVCLVQFGLSRKLENWTAPKEVYRKLQQLTREREQIVDERSMVKNQKHAEEAEAFPNESTVKRLMARIIFLNQQESEIKKEIDNLIVSDTDLKEKVDNICSIPGVGKITASTILGETNGFELIRNKRQLSSYAGFDIVEKLSGTSVKTKSRVSKKGNKHIRKAMHYPALSAVRHDENYKNIYVRILQNTGIKMKGLVAVARKILELIFVLFKENKKYDVDYEKKKADANLATASC